MSTKTRASIEDLYNVPGNSKAEIIDGEVVIMCPTGGKPGRAGGKVYRSLDDHEANRGGGYAFPDNVGFVVNLPNRDSFSPDAAWYVGELKGLDYPEGAPAFAVEVRSKNDYGPQAERAIAEKIQDYFMAGTLVVWDVDLLGDDVIRGYGRDDPYHPTIYRRGEVADAEPAVPGWRMPVDDLFS